MAIEIIMPQGGQDIDVGKVVHWLKAEGDHVVQGEIICEVETEKAVFEVEAPGEGYLRRIVVQEDEETSIFSVIGYIGDLEEEIPFGEAVEDSSEGEVVPEAPSTGKAKEIPLSMQGDRIQASPRARRLSDEKSVPLDQVKGSGAGGRIKEKDVLAFLEAQAGETVTATTTQIDGGQVISMSRVQSVTARKMQQSKQKVPHFYVTLSVDMTEAMCFRDEFNRELKDPENDSISVTDLIIRACVLAFQEHPELNSSVLDEERIVLWEDLNIGLAVAIDSELVVPVMEQIDQQSLEGIARERRRLVRKVKEGKQPSLAPARFTISNLGMFHVDQFLAIINPPETAILAVSSIEKRPSTIDDQTVVLRDMLNLSLSIDHRVAGGVIACRFLNAIKTTLEDPARLGR